MKVALLPAQCTVQFSLLDNSVQRDVNDLTLALSPGDIQSPGNKVVIKHDIGSGHAPLPYPYTILRQKGVFRKSLLWKSGLAGQIEILREVSTDSSVAGC
jgi:hypothetical protein